MKIPDVDHDYIPSRNFSSELYSAARGVLIDQSVYRDRREAPGFTVEAQDKNGHEAIWFERTRIGSLVKVSVLDVEALVKKDSALDLEALKRVEGNLKDSLLWPSILTDNIMSLRYDLARPTITVSVDLDRNFNVVGSQVDKTFVRSRQQFGNGEFNERLIDGGGNFGPLLDTAIQLGINRTSQDEVAVREGEGKVALKKISGYEQERTFGEFVIEELMILTNYVVACLLEEAKIPTLYRNFAFDERGKERKEIQVANYSPIANGHADLNLPRYVHFTSPVSRFADLVTLRSVKAAIEKKPHVYGDSEIDELANYLNVRGRGIFLHRNYHRHKALQSEYAWENARNWSAKKLADHDGGNLVNFCTIFEEALSDTELLPKFAEAFKERFKLGKILPRDVGNLFFLAELKGEEWNEVRGKALELIFNDAAFSFEFFNILRQRFKSWQTLKVRVWPEEDGFRSRAFMEKDKRLWTSKCECFSEEGESAAKRMAMLGLFMGALTDELVEHTQMDQHLTA